MVRFFLTGTGREPVRDWLKSLPEAERKAIGDDIRTIQFGWPLGMPLVRKLMEGLWELRTDLPSGICRVLFTVDNGMAVLLHGFLKKTQKIPKNELDTARKRLKLVQRKD
jgi:phage-related protein